MENIVLRQWQTMFNNGLFDSSDRKTQIKAGWYDWFCKDSSLRNKTYRMGRIVNQIKDGGKVSLDKHYVLFKNKCPLNGVLYDAFTICEIDTWKAILTIEINCSFNKCKYSVFGEINVFKTPLFETENSEDLIKWFNTGWEESNDYSNC